MQELNYKIFDSCNTVAKVQQKLNEVVGKPAVFELFDKVSKNSGIDLAISEARKVAEFILRLEDYEKNYAKDDGFYNRELLQDLELLLKDQTDSNKNILKILDAWYFNIVDRTITDLLSTAEIGGNVFELKRKAEFLLDGSISLGEEEKNQIEKILRRADEVLSKRKERSQSRVTISKRIEELTFKLKNLKKAIEEKKESRDSLGLNNILDLEDRFREGEKETLELLEGKEKNIFSIKSGDKVLKLSTYILRQFLLNFSKEVIANVNVGISQPDRDKLAEEQKKNLLLVESLCDQLKEEMEDESFEGKQIVHNDRRIAVGSENEGKEQMMKREQQRIHEQERENGTISLSYLSYEEPLIEYNKILELVHLWSLLVKSGNFERVIASEKLGNDNPLEANYYLGYYPVNEKLIGSQFYSGGSHTIENLQRLEWKNLKELVVWINENFSGEVKDRFLRQVESEDFLTVSGANNPYIFNRDGDSKAEILASSAKAKHKLLSLQVANLSAQVIVKEKELKESEDNLNKNIADSAFDEEKGEIERMSKDLENIFNNNVNACVERLEKLYKKGGEDLKSLTYTEIIHLETFISVLKKQQGVWNARKAYFEDIENKTAKKLKMLKRSCPDLIDYYLTRESTIEKTLSSGPYSIEKLEKMVVQKEIKDRHFVSSDQERKDFEYIREVIKRVEAGEKYDDVVHKEFPEAVSTLNLEDLKSIYRYQGPSKDLADKLEEWKKLIPGVNKENVENIFQIYTIESERENFIKFLQDSQGYYFQKESTSDKWGEVVGNEDTENLLKIFSKYEFSIANAEELKREMEEAQAPEEYYDNDESKINFIFEQKIGKKHTPMSSDKGNKYSPENSTETGVTGFVKRNWISLTITGILVVSSIVLFIFREAFSKWWNGSEDEEKEIEEENK